MKPKARMAAERLPARDLHAAERYLESLLDSDEPLSPGERETIQESIEGIRRGEMTLADFERKHGA